MISLSFARLTNADRKRTFSGRAMPMSVLPSEIILELSAFFGGPFRARTGDPLIKSQLLYQLS